MSGVWRKTIFCFLIFLILFNLNSAKPTIESRVLQHEIFLGEQIDFEWVVEGLNDSDILRIYELPCVINDSGIKCPSIKLDYRIQEINISGITSSVKIIPSHSGVLRICADLLHGGMDCDKDNYLLVKEIRKEVETQVVTEVKEVEKIVEKVVEKIEYVIPKPSFVLEVIEWPKTIRAGKNISIILNISNPCNFSQQVNVYSYLFNSSHCYTGGWTKNKEQVILAPFSSSIINLTNQVNDSVNGTATLRVRAKVNGTNYDSSKEYNILERQYYDLQVGEEHNFTNKNTNLTIFLENTGNIPANITIKLLSNNGTLSFNFSVKNSLKKTFTLNSTEFVLQVLDKNELLYSKFIAKPRILLKNKITGSFLATKQEIISFSNKIITKQNTLYMLTSIFSLIGLYFLTKKY